MKLISLAQKGIAPKLGNIATHSPVPLPQMQYPAHLEKPIIAPPSSDQQPPPSKPAPPDPFGGLLSDLGFSDLNGNNGDAAQNNGNAITLQQENENLKLEVMVARQAQAEALKQSQEALSSVQPLRVENEKLKQMITELRKLVQTKGEELEALECDLDELRLKNESGPTSNNSELESLRSQISALKVAKNESHPHLRVENYANLYFVFDHLAQ